MGIVIRVSQIMACGVGGIFAFSAKIVTKRQAGSFLRGFFAPLKKLKNYDVKCEDDVAGG